MFNSRNLLWKKGLLGSAWTAAHCVRRLKKAQVVETDIVACVDAILNGEADEVTYRILASLLLGVVRIYSKKVELLNHDSTNMLREATKFVTGQRVSRSIISYSSITLPETFELDAFNLDILEGQDLSRIHVSSREDITLADDSRREIGWENDKYYGQEDISSHGAFSSANTPVKDVFSSWFMDGGFDSISAYDINILNSSMEKLVGTRFSFGQCLERRMLGEIEKEPGSDMLSNEGCQTDREQKKHHDVGVLMEKSIDNMYAQPMGLGGAEKESDLDMLLDEGQTGGEQIKCSDVEINHQEQASLDKSIDNESVESMMLGNIEEEPGFDMPSDEGCETDGGLLEHSDVRINCQEPARTEKSVDSNQSIEKLCQFGVSPVDHLLPVILGKVDKVSCNAMPSEGHQILEEQIKHPDSRINSEEPDEMRLPEMTSSTNHVQGKSPLSISVSKIRGVGSPELTCIRTPATKERARALKKRKCLVDKEVIISNEVLQKLIKDSSDLVRKRSVASSSVSQASKKKQYIQPETYFKPLIPCKGLNFRSLLPVKKSITRLLVETAEIPVSPVVTQTSVAPAETPVDPVVLESAITQMSPILAKTPADPILVTSSIGQISSETAEAPVDTILLKSPVTQISHEQTPVAPTPFTRSTSWRLHGVEGLPEPDASISASSFNCIDKQFTYDDEQESDIGLRNEGASSSVSDKAEKCGWSAQTRRVATNLHQNMSDLKLHKGHNEFLNLSQGLERETKTDCARLFYEILVLKSGNYIDVKQENAYGDILVQEKPKLKQTIDAYGNTVPD